MPVSGDAKRPLPNARRDVRCERIWSPVSGDGTYPRNGNFFNLDRLKPDQLPGERVPHRCPLDRNRPIRVRPILKSTATEATATIPDGTLIPEGGTDSFQSPAIFGAKPPFCNGHHIAGGMTLLA